VIVLGVAATLASATIGPFVEALLLRTDFDLANRVIGLLALSCAFFMVAVAIGQSLIALSSQAHLAVAWAAGLLVFVIVTALGNDLYLRVEIGLVVGTATTAALVAVLLAVQLSAVSKEQVDRSS
jgi:hypothetical protein